MHAMYFHRISYFVLELVITLRRLSIAHGVFREGGGGGEVVKRDVIIRGPSYFLVNALGI